MAWRADLTMRDVFVRDVRSSMLRFAPTT